MTFVTYSARLLGLGSLVFGGWGLIHPTSLTMLLGDDPSLGRVLGARDAIVGVGLLASGGPVPLALRTVSDLHDAYRLRQRSPLVALGAAGVALWGGLAFTLALTEWARPEAASGVQSHMPDDLIV